MGIACDEVTTPAHVDAVWAAFGVDPAGAGGLEALDAETADAIPDELRRTTPFLTHPVFHQHHSETAMLRYLRRLADDDLALDRTMIPLGSCTMKLNATTEMDARSRWPEFAAIHPFAPREQTRGLPRADPPSWRRWLGELTGYDAVSIQPNAGSQGEFAGLLAIRAYHRARGDTAPRRLPDPGVGPRHQRGVAP